jgi:hypothetical protein
VQVSRICDLCLYMRRGQVVASGVTDEILELYRRDQPVSDLRNSQILDPLVKKFNCSLATESCSWGDELAVTIHLELAKPIQCGLALIAVHEGEISVAQFEITQDLNLNHASRTDAIFRIGPVHLREGVYGMSITILSESRKKTLVHALNVVSFKVIGPKGYGVPYQLPIKRLATKPCDQKSSTNRRLPDPRRPWHPASGSGHPQPLEDEDSELR